MKIKTLYLILFITLLATACSPGSVATNESVESSVAQPAENSPTAAQEQDANSEQESPVGDEIGQGQADPLDESNNTEKEATVAPDSEQAIPDTGSFILSSPDAVEAGALPIEYTCDGANATLPLTWSGAPAGTESFAIVMRHVPGPGDTHWYWVLYDIPAGAVGLSKNSAGIGVLGTNSVNGNREYAPPCSKGSGEKAYTYTVYALSASPQFSVPVSQVNRDALLEAIQDITLASAELNVTYNRSATQEPDINPEQESAAGADSGQGHTPPEEAIAACTGKTEQDACEFTWERGAETGVCETVQERLTCSPERLPSDGEQSDQNGNRASGGQAGENGAAYNIEQALSDRAQSTTISFDALAFLTGDLGADSFFPPGKMADFWGFQYMRDNDPSQMGHNTDFLTKAAFNMLYILTPEQRAALATLAEGQVDSINEYGYMRFVMMDAFRRLLEDDLPAGTAGLDEEAVKTYSAALYRLDGEISFERAQVMGGMISSLDDAQRAYLDSMVGQGMLEWPDVEEPLDLRNLDRDVKVAVMTYAGDMFSWYLGSLEADVYFCPERQGTYFGSFYLKDAPAMGNPDYTISSSLTGDMGSAMSGILTADQAQLITGLVDVQRPYLLGIVDVREQVSMELRKFMTGGAADSAAVLSQMENYGELDGAIVYNFAVNFARVNETLTGEQKAELMAFREEMLGDMMYPFGAYLYSQPISMPEILNTDFLFK